MSSSLSALRDIHAQLARENATKIGARDTVKAWLAASQAKVKGLNAKQQDIADGILLVQKFSEGIQTGVVQRFEDLLTRGIRQIFNKQYTASIEFSVSGNTLNADFFMILPDGKKVSLANGEGGGLRDLVAVLQRVLYIALEPTRPARILFLDENMKALDVGRAPAAFTFIKDLCGELDIQVIFITHAQAAIDTDGSGIKVITIGG
jgi:translation initiation factor RLI1